MSTWIIIDAVTSRELGTVRNQFRLIGSKIVAEGTFGHYVIRGNFGNRSYTIKKGEEEVKKFFFHRIQTKMLFIKVAKIEKKSFHLHDTYGLTVYGDADQGLMVLFAIIVDEIREH